jgi:putative membrane protein
MKKLVSTVLGMAMVCALGSLAHAQAPTDPQIVGIVQTANRIDIEMARLALKKTTDPQVKDFANEMISDHTALEKSVNDLAAKLGVKEETSSTAQQLKQQALQERRKLNTLKGKSFDREYASHEVAYHQTVIDAATKTLIPDAQNAQLKSALQGAAPVLQGHMQHAQQLVQSLQGGGSGF